MRVMTFNIQHGLDYKNQIIDLSLFSRYVGAQNVDFCALNEVRGEGNWEGYTDQTGFFVKELGHSGFFGEAIKVAGTNPYGNAFLTRYTVRSAEVVHIPDSDDRSEDVHYEHRCAIRAVVDVDKTDVMFIVCHMGLAKTEAENAVRTLCELLDETDLPAVVMGDFNHTAESEVLAPLFERLSDTDSLSGKKGVYTFPSYDPREKIDYILYRGLDCTFALVKEDIVSDHFPIIAELNVIKTE